MGDPDQSRDVPADTAECRLCGASAPPGAKYCADCGKSLRCIAGGATPPVSVPTRESGTLCRGCGQSAPVIARFCAFCGTGLSPSTPVPRPASALAETVVGLPALEPLLDDLEVLLGDPGGSPVWLLERGTDDVLVGLRDRLDEADVARFELASHPSRARVASWELAALAEAVERPELAEALRSDRPGREALLEALLEAIPAGRPAVLLDRAHRSGRDTLSVLGELHALGAIRLLLRSPHPADHEPLGRRATEVVHPAIERYDGRAMVEAAQGLPGPVADTLNAAAVLGWRAPLPALEAAVGPGLELGLDALEAHGVLVVDAGHATFADPDFADRLLAAMSSAEASRWSEAALDWSADQGEPPEVRAEYASRIDDLPTALLALDIAGRRALERGDRAAAAELFARGLARIRFALGREADRAVTRASARMARQLAEVLLLDGDHRSAEGVLREALERPLLESGERAELMLVAAGVALGRGRIPQATRSLEEAVELAQRADRPALTVDAGVFLALAEEAGGAPANDVSAMVVAALSSLGDASPSKQLGRLLRSVVRRLAARGQLDVARAMVEDATPLSPKLAPLLEPLRAAIDAA